MSKTCFVIGQIGDAGSPTRRESDDFMKYIVAPVLSDVEGFDRPVRADHLHEPGRITTQVIKHLLEDDLVIADLTGGNANVYYELSLRHAIGKPVIHLAAAGTQLSFDIRDNRTIFYTMHSRNVEEVKLELLSQIRHVQDPNYRSLNPIVETNGIINLERSAEPEKEALGRLLAMITDLKAEITYMRAGQAERTSLNQLSNIAADLMLPSLKSDRATMHRFQSSFHDCVMNESSLPLQVKQTAVARVITEKAEPAYRRSDALEKRRELMQAWVAYLPCRPRRITAARRLPTSATRRVSTGDNG